MGRLAISYGGHLSDRVQDLYDGRIEPEGVDLHFIPLRPVDAFNRMLQGDFHCAEMSFSTYIIRAARGDLPFVAIPVFPSRTFRHGNIYVNRRAGVTEPAQLRGRRVGVPEYGMTAAVWARGMLMHDYGVSPTEIQWVTGGLQEPGRRPMVELEVDGIQIEPAPGLALNDMLLSGEIDALIAPQIPPALAAGNAELAYLFPDVAAVERDYFERTRLFPIMHVVVLRRDLHEQHPWVAVSLYQAFERAKNNALSRLAIEEPPAISLPWLADHARSIRALMGDDFWPYGVEANRPVIEALCRYLHEQGLVAAPVSVESLFASNVLQLSRVKL